MRGLEMKKIILVFVCLIIFSSNIIKSEDFADAEKMFRKGKYSDAEAIHRKALEKHKKNKKVSAYLHYQIAECYRYQKQSQHASDEFRYVISKYPDTEFAAEAQYKIAEMYYRKKDYAQAAEEFTKYTENYPNNPNKEKAYGFTAMCHEMSGNHIKAIMTFDTFKKEQKSPVREKIDRKIRK